MLYTRRDLGKVALAAGFGARLAVAANPKPNSKINGVQIGAITYSFRSMPGADSDAHKVLEYCLASGISAIELMDGPAEAFAGAPHGSGTDWESPNKWTPEQQRAAAELKKWRLSQSMDKYQQLRKLYRDAGVSIYAHKQTPTLDHSDAEWDYFFQMAAALGASHVTTELPEDEAYLKKLGAWALKYKLRVGYHAHTQARPDLWDKALAVSEGNAINLDIGHYVAGTGESPLPLMEKHHQHIVSLHLKDRKKQGSPGGDNLPWGQGSTPIKEVLQAMRKNKWRFPASIELEYEIPAGSDAVKEVARCLAYCRSALGESHT